MKTSLKKLLIKGFLMFLILGIVNACKDEEVVPPVPPPAITKPVLPEAGLGKLVTDVTSFTETNDGYKFQGSIGAEIDNTGKINIAEGSFEFVVDVNRNVIKITGEGLVDFPNVGVFQKIRETFAWEKIKSHIEYEKGKFFKDTYLTDIPLNDDRYYFHFQVFDETKEGFSLKHLGNLVVYNFSDFYLDINDPAVFFKLQLWKPGSGAKSEATSIAKKLFSKAVSLGKAVKDYASAPGIVFGISNQATIKSSTYEFSKPDVFEKLYGYSGFDEINSHGYIKLKNIPIPETVILRLTGDMYIHGPLEKGAPSPTDLIEKRQAAFVDWFNESELGPVSRTFNGSMDFGGKGIGAVFGILDGIDNALGYDILNNDFNFDLVGAVYQEQDAGINGEAKSFMRFGGEVSKPILGEIFGPEISKYIPSQPTPTGFLYFNIEDDLANWSLFIQSTADINIPTIGKKEFKDSYFLLNKDGLLVEGKLDLPTFGIFNFKSAFKGMIGPNGFDLESDYSQDITLPNNVTLASKSLIAKVSSDIAKGMYLEGSIGLPFGITDAHVLAIANIDKVSFEGSFSQDLDFDFGFKLPSRSMTFKTSSDPAEGLSFAGEMDIPHIGYNSVTGILNKSVYSFSGVVNTMIDFGSVQLPLVNGALSISSTGIALSGLYTLPLGLKTATMNGSTTPNEIKVSGTIATGLTLGGYNFSFSNSYITASSLTGVKLGGNIDLKVFSVKVDGTILPNGNFKLTGTKTHTTSLIKTTMNVVVTQSGVSLTGTGTIYGLLGNELASGTVTFKPNWAAGTIEACIGSFCVNL